MTKFQWRAESATELATLLRHAEIKTSAALGTSTIYQIMHEGREKLALALADGLVLIIENAEPTKVRRRRIDPLKKVKAEA
ncbi:MAG: hypothetical protein V4447_14090 [Pseudomonadota bacterium]